MLYLDTEVDTMKQYAQYYKLPQFYFVSKKNTTKQRWSSLWLLLLFIAIKTQAQYNLVPNSSFEIFTKCPQLNDNPPPHPWYVPSSVYYQKTYLNACDVTSCTSVPYNCLGATSYQPARTGNAYVLIACYYTQVTTNERLYIQARLKDSLKNNKKYYAEFYVSLTNVSNFACNNLSMLFTQKVQYVDTLVSPYALLAANAQIVNYGNPIIKDTMNWVKVSGIFTAQGGEQFITIGNFKDDSQTDTITVNSNSAVSYGSGFYLDDVSVIPLDSMCLKADAGRDTTIKLGDSVFIGSYTNGIDTLMWLQNGTTKYDSTRPGFWVKPTSAGTYMYVLQQTVNGCFSKDTVYINVTTLPLTIVNYKLLIVNDRQVLNEWTTANEVNVSHYNIERSTNAQDFTIIGKVKANNKSSNEYRFADNVKTEELIDRKTVYYRVVGVDFDGRKTYSTTKQITLKPQTPNNVFVFPNPAKDVVHIESKEAIKEVKVIDYLGREVSKLLVNSPTTYQLVINNYQLAKGVYVVQVTTTTGKVFNEKLLVQ